MNYWGSAFFKVFDFPLSIVSRLVSCLTLLLLFLSCLTFHCVNGGDIVNKRVIFPSFLLLRSKALVSSEMNSLYSLRKQRGLHGSTDIHHCFDKIRYNHYFGTISNKVIRRYYRVNGLNIKSVDRISGIIQRKKAHLSQSLDAFLFSSFSSSRNFSYFNGILHRSTNCKNKSILPNTLTLRNVGISSTASLNSEAKTTLNAFEINKRFSADMSREEKYKHLPVIVMHGLMGSSRNWRSLINNLHTTLEKPREFILPDLRNHGDSPHLEKMDYSVMADDIIELMNSRSLDKCILIGHSMGGKVASAAALKYPDRISGIIVLDIAPIAYSTTDGSHWAETSNVIRVLKKVPLHQIQDRKEADQFLIEQGFNDPSFRGFLLSNLTKNMEKSGGTFKWKVNLPAISDGLASIANFPYTPDDKKIKPFEGNSLFINGGKSRYLLSSHLPVISKLFPVFSLATIRDAGHWVHSEKPQETSAMIARYLDENAP